jgi:hypothetical protein
MSDAVKHLIEGMAKVLKLQGVRNRKYLFINAYFLKILNNCKKIYLENSNQHLKRFRKKTDFRF